MKGAFCLSYVPWYILLVITEWLMIKEMLWHEFLFPCFISIPIFKRNLVLFILMDHKLLWCGLG